LQNVGNENTEENFPLENILLDVASLLDENPASVESINHDKLIELQQSDSALQLFALSQQSDPGCMLHSGVLVHVYHDSVSLPDVALYQIVAPVALRPSLLQIAHEIPAAAHLGIAKTTNRLQRHFYWPGITRDVKLLCQTCDVCQRLSKAGPLAVAPLHSTPLVSEPFCQITTDIVGPFSLSVKREVTDLF